MFGVYSNQRLSENETKLLYMNPDDLNWYCVVVQTVFKDNRFFQIREDIKLPQNDDDNGVVLIFEGGDIVYFKSIDGEITETEVESITNVCTYLEEKFNRPITAYVPCSPFKNLNIDFEKNGKDITIMFSYLLVDDAEDIVDKLENKLKNNEEFTISDSIDHMTLPFRGYRDKQVFEEKFKHYMELVETHNFD